MYDNNVLHVVDVHEYKTLFRDTFSYSYSTGEKNPIYVYITMIEESVKLTLLAVKIYLVFTKLKLYGSRY